MIRRVATRVWERPGGGGPPPGAGPVDRGTLLMTRDPASPGCAEGRSFGCMDATFGWSCAVAGRRGRCRCGHGDRTRRGVAQHTWERSATRSGCPDMDVSDATSRDHELAVRDAVGDSQETTRPGVWRGTCGLMIEDTRSRGHAP